MQFTFLLSRFTLKTKYFIECWFLKLKKWLCYYKHNDVNLPVLIRAQCWYVYIGGVNGWGGLILNVGDQWDSCNLAAAQFVCGKTLNKHRSVALSLASFNPAHAESKE